MLEVNHDDSRRKPYLCVPRCLFKPDPAWADPTWADPAWADPASNPVGPYLRMRSALASGPPARHGSVQFDYGETHLTQRNATQYNAMQRNSTQRNTFVCGGGRAQNWWRDGGERGVGVGDMAAPSHVAVHRVGLEGPSESAHRVARDTLPHRVSGRPGRVRYCAAMGCTRTTSLLLNGRAPRVASARRDGRAMVNGAL